MVKILVQWAITSSQPWYEIDSQDWPSLPVRPEPRNPRGTDNADLQPGWINALNVQGVVFTGFDHYAVESHLIISDAIKVTMWNDDPEDFTVGTADDRPGPGLLGRVLRTLHLPHTKGRWDEHGMVWTFGPLGPDPAQGGLVNTKQTVVKYAAPRTLAAWQAEPPAQDVELRPWSAFVKPASGLVRHGIWLAQDTMRESDRTRELHSWREWTEGAPTNLIESGLVRAQGPVGRGPGTIRYQQRDALLSTGVHAATHERAFDKFLGAATSTLTHSQSFGSGGLAVCFTSPAFSPNRVNWASGVYRMQLDVTAAGAGLQYGLLSAGAGAQGHFAVVNSGLTADITRMFQSGGNFTGTGLKLAVASGDPAAGAIGDRFEGLIGVRNTATMNNPQDLTIRVGGLDGYADGPWPNLRYLVSGGQLTTDETQPPFGYVTAAGQRMVQSGVAQVLSYDINAGQRIAEQP